MSQVQSGVAIAAVVLALAGCGPGAATPAPAPTPTPEPREAVVQALRSTAALNTVHAFVRVDLLDRGKAFKLTLEGDVEVAARELDVAATFEPAFFGMERAWLVIVDGTVFSRSNEGAWTVSGTKGEDPLAAVPTTARIAAAVEKAIRDPATSITPGPTEPCGEDTCLRIRAEIPVEVAWRAVTEMLTTVDGPPAMTMPETFPGFAVDLWIEQDTLRLRQATNSTVIDRLSVAITVNLSRHDVPVSIQAPINP